MPITTMPDGARSRQLASVNMEYFVSVLFVNTSCSDFNAVKDFKASVQATQINGENAQSAIANNPSRDDSLSTIENAVSNQATVCVTDYLSISLDPSIERHGRFEQQSYFVHHNHRWRWANFSRWSVTFRRGQRTRHCKYFWIARVLDNKLHDKLHELNITNPQFTSRSARRLLSQKKDPVRM